MRITGGAVCCPEGIKRQCDLVVRDGRVFLEPHQPKASQSTETIDVAGSYILPGFLEIHTHGAGLFEFTAGRYRPETQTFDCSQEIYQRELPRYAHLRASTGVTALYLGTWAAPIEQQQFCFRQLQKYIASPGNGKDGSLILGGLLEGTFINPRMSGAQNPDFIYKPDIDLFERLNETGVIKLANVVPDFDENSCRLIDHLTRHSVSVGAGHTCATANQFRRAIDVGLKYCIHFLNGPITGSFKTFDGGGAIEAVLGEDMDAELIMDGVHVAPRYVLDVLARKGCEKILAVSDAMFSSQAQGVDEFSISGITGRVDPQGRYVHVVGREKLTLFSSLLTMDLAFTNLLSWLTVDTPGAWTKNHPARTLEQAMTIASRCCATNIADMLRRRSGDDIETGRLTDGKWADFIIANIAGQPGNYRLKIRAVYVRGRQVYTTNPENLATP